MQREVTDTFYILDFDRCLGDVDACYELFVSVLRQHSTVERSQLDKIRHSVELSGGSFDLVRSLVDTGILTVVEMNKLLDAVVKQAQPEKILLPGARELLNKLEKASKQYMIMTYGGQEWQKTKLKATGLYDHVPCMITDQKQKGSLLKGWQQNDGTFLIPEHIREHANITAKKIVLVDDKVTSFKGFPEPPSYGYQVAADHSPLAEQKGALPPNVYHVANLDELVNQEF